MPAEMIVRQTFDDAALQHRRRELSSVRAALAEQEAEVAQVRAQLKSFEGRYLRQVGVLYAELDALEAKIASREVDLYDSDAARRRADDARQRAQETQEAAFGDVHEAEEIDPPASLKSLFREVAKRIHPDFARDEDEQKHFTLLMARANLAYGRGDLETLQRLLDDHREIHASVAEAGGIAEHIRLGRQIEHARRDLARLAVEKQTMLAGEIGQLHLDAEAAACEDRDLLIELAGTLRIEIAEAQRRFDLIDRQISAHGR